MKLLVPPIFTYIIVRLLKGKCTAADGETYEIAKIHLTIRT